MEDLSDTGGILSSLPPQPPASQPENPKQTPENGDSDKEKKDKEDIDMIRSAISMGSNPLPCIPYGAMPPGLTEQDIIDLVQINDRLFPRHIIDDMLV